MNEKNQIENYINNLDFSIIDSISIDVILKEIKGFENDLCLSQYANSNFEKIIYKINNLNILINLLKNIDIEKVIYKKLGSRIIEAIFTQIFILFYSENKSCKNHEEIDILTEISKNLDFLKSLKNQNANFPLRKFFMILFSKKIENNKIIKFNKKLIKKNIKNNIKNIIYTNLKTFKEDYTFNTILVYLQCKNDQILIKKIIKKLKIEKIIKNEFFYENLFLISDENNKNLIYRAIKSSFNILIEKCDFFMQKFIKNINLNIFKDINYNECSRNINISLLINQQKLQNHKNIEEILIKYFNYENKESLFYFLLLNKYNSLDTKFLEVIGNFMKFSKENNFNVNEDFVKYFEKSFLNSKSGRILIFYFLDSSEEEIKRKFFNEKINLFFNCLNWENSKSLIKKIYKITTGTSKNKALDMMRRINKKII